MTNFILETSLLLLGCFLAGCMLGCFVRRLLAADVPVKAAARAQPAQRPAPLEPAQPRATLAPETRPAAPVAPRPVQPAPTVKAPVKIDEAFRRADLDKPVPTAPGPQAAATAAPPAPTPLSQPRVEPPAPRPSASPAPVAARPEPVPPRPAAPPAPVVNVSRAAPVPQAAVVQRPAPAPSRVPAEAVVPSPAPVAVRPQPAPSAAKPAPIQPAEAIKPVAPGPSTTSASALAAATAAAAAAAIAEGRARDRKAIEQVKPAAAQPRLELPNVATTPGAGAVAVPGHMQATRPPLAPGDDLKRIQTVTPEIEAALNKLGVRRYGDIASWSAQEVSRVAQALGLRGRIEQENWIEQAQILSKGVATAYSNKYDRGELVTSAQPSKSAPAASLSPEARTAMTAAALTAARVMSTAKAPITVPSASIAAATAAAEKVASAIAPSVAPARPLAPGPSAADRAKQLASTLAAPIAPAPSAAKPSVTPLPQPPPETVVTGDDLKRIRGIDRDLERLLNRLGVTSFASIARWSPGEIDHYGAALGLASGRIQRESWVEQARVLAGATLLAEARAPGAAPEEARVVRQRMVSVKSEALQDRFETGMARGGRNVRSGIPDDLKRIKGIGVVLETKLNAIGVIGYEQIAAWTDADVQRVSEQLDFKGRIERENWIEQARILASGGMTEFARRFDRGEVEAPPPRKA